jgi:hypothetical protein
VRQLTNGVKEQKTNFRNYLEKGTSQMDILKQKDLQQLINTSGEWCVSIYLPTHKFGREQQQDPIRFKNLMTKAQEKLLDSGLRKPEVQELMRPAESLLDDKDFWQHQSDGLAVFLSPNTSQIFRLPTKFDEVVIVANNFHIKPLLPLLSKDGKFYILALSMNEVRLFLGTRDAIDNIDLGNIPANMQEALWMDDPEKHTDFHTGTSNARAEGMRQAVFHGHGAKEADEKTNILRFFQHINQGLNDLLEEQDIPMILAGVDYLLPIYREANTYASLLDKSLEGNPEELDAIELRKLAWELVQPIFKEDQKQALEHFEQLDGQENGLASKDLKTVVKAANFGRVETLFVPLGVQRWGKYDTQQNMVIVNEAPDPDNEDLLDFAAMHTLFNSGKVYAIQPEKIPGNGELAAILRYAT